MKIGFDLDGTLDRQAVRNLLMALLREGWEVYVISGVFTEAGAWQNGDAKRAKMNRLGIPFDEFPGPAGRGRVKLHILEAMPESYPRDYRLADLGLRKGALCESLGIDLFVDDSATYCEMIPKMAGDVTVIQVR
jgi:hypothetical protein